MTIVLKEKKLNLREPQVKSLLLIVIDLKILKEKNLL